MVGRTGYRVYFDKETGKFRYDKEPSQARFMGKDSVTYWAPDMATAMKAVQNRNLNDLENVIVCKDCGNGFFVSDAQRAWYAEKDLSLPCRCESCRKKKKERSSK